MSEKQVSIYTIGHSNHAAEKLVSLLQSVQIEVLADVRSTPFSRRHPQFNKERLAAALKEAGISYVFLGDGLGARPKDPACYRNGRADYALIAQSSAFRESLQRVLQLAQAHRVALMCAEKEPLDCHRTILVGHELKAVGAELRHILADGRIEAHAETEARLLKRMKLDRNELFASEEDLLERAYKERGAQMGVEQKA